MRQKTREATRKVIDRALDLRLRQLCQEWERLLGTPISEIEMGRLFAEFGKMDVKIVIRMKEGNHGL